VRFKAEPLASEIPPTCFECTVTEIQRALNALSPKFPRRPSSSAWRFASRGSEPPPASEGRLCPLPASGERVGVRGGAGDRGLCGGSARILAPLSGRAAKSSRPLTQPSPRERGEGSRRDRGESRSANAGDSGRFEPFGPAVERERRAVAKSIVRCFGGIHLLAASLPAAPGVSRPARRAAAPRARRRRAP